MTDGIHPIQSQTIRQAQPRAGDEPTPAKQNTETTAPSRDSVEISDIARRHEDDAPIRQELVDRVRAEIADDAYLSADKLDEAAQRLLSDVLRRL